MATIKVAPSGAIEAVYVDGLDITKHVLGEPFPKVVKTSGDASGIYALDLRLALERPREAGNPKLVPVDTADVRELCEPSTSTAAVPRAMCEEFGDE